MTNLNSGFFAFLGVKLKQKLNEDAYLSHLNIFFIYKSDEIAHYHLSISGTFKKNSGDFLKDRLETPFLKFSNLVPWVY